jgi:tetratricopeptide (TPR) repeat protein
MKCEDIKEYLYEYHTLRLGKELFTEVDEHLKTCVQCQQDLNELEETINLLNRAKPPEVANDFKDKVMARCEFNTVPFYKRRPYRLVLQGALAAMIVIAVATTVKFIMQPVREETVREMSRGVTAKDVCAKAVALYNEGTLSSDLSLKEKLLNDALSQRCEDKTIQAKTHNNLADCYEQKGLVDEAIQGYEKAIALDPELAAPYLSLGDIYKKKGMFKEADKYYRTGKQLAEKDDNLSKK